jgi:ABC-type lipoprotein export system ATPase subunit
MIFFCGFDFSFLSLALITETKKKTQQKIREHVSFMEQEDVLLELLTVVQFLRVVCDVRSVDYSVLPEFLKVMDLLGFENALLNTLSGGQRRKVGGFFLPMEIVTNFEGVFDCCIGELSKVACFG